MSDAAIYTCILAKDIKHPSGTEKYHDCVLVHDYEALLTENAELKKKVRTEQAKAARMREAIKDILDECPRSVDEATVARGNGSLYERIVRHPEHVVWNFSISEMRLKKLRKVITSPAAPEKAESYNGYCKDCVKYKDCDFSKGPHDWCDEGKGTGKPIAEGEEI